ncbi:MAG: hypothetical protein AB8B58_02055 [Roseobacter sp.]
MSNVISIGFPRRPNLQQRQIRLLEQFVLKRRPPTDVYWLKENAELLNILASSKAQLPQDALAPYAGFYQGLSERIRFFPQYYRFLVSMCLDLEDLGFGGDTGASLCAWVAENGLAEVELSDLQRAEARHLLSRRDIHIADDGLDDRLERFAERSATFVLPNKKAAYELTHMVFYRSGYGARDFAASEALITSLEYAGLLAFLDQDIDLLAEVCVALRFAGQRPSDIWEDWLALQLEGFTFEPATGQVDQDAYHEYLVTNWWSMLNRNTGFSGAGGDGAAMIVRHGAPTGPLRAMSECMFHLGRDRSTNWTRMRDVISNAIGQDASSILAFAERSSPRFDAFFEGFARADR